MGKEGKLDEILNVKRSKIQSNLLNIYKGTRFLLNKNIEEGKGNIINVGDGNIEYSLAIDTDKYRFRFTYSNFNHPHLQIDVAKSYSQGDKWEEVSKGYGMPDTVFDVIEQANNNLHVKTYLPGEDGHAFDKWEDALMKLMQETSHRPQNNV
jgi:hypothetical protein